MDYSKNGRALLDRLNAAQDTVRGLLGRGTPAVGGDWLKLVPAPVRDLVAARLPAAPRTPAAAATGGQFLARSFANEAGARPYKLFVPSAYAGQSVPLVVMLHGCTQSPDDFAAGTAMNQAAEAQGFLVAYPAQTQAANAQKCWNWFNGADQRRGAGEPAIVAGITREVMRDYAIDPARVYVAGLSAGGAAAANLGAAYPELYAAVGVHSGLACGAAHDLPSALAAMRHGAAGAAGGVARKVPVIVFHGDRDTTVSPLNAAAVVGQAVVGGTTQTRRGQVPGGRGYDCVVHRDASGAVLAEQWTVHGAGHAWSGGSAAGTYTDPLGPDATGEMVRFFREHVHRAPG